MGIVKAKALKNKGKNIWVYEPDDKVFAGLELESDFQDNGHGLEKKKIIVEKYAYCKHVGPYHLIKQTGQRMTDQLNNQGLQVTLPYIEIYGHWSSDETKLETDLLMALK